MLGISLLVAAIARVCLAQSSTFSPLRPPAIPLAVKSPFMNTWQQAGSDGGNGGYLAGQWPTFWAGQITGWTGLIRVDNATYVWLGAPANMTSLVTQTAFEYTSTRSIFTMDVGGLVSMTITFLSNVTPNDLLRSSLPYTYMEVDVASSDGNDHDVQIYTDISAEWISGTRTNLAQWSYGSIADSVDDSPKLIPPAGPESSAVHKGFSTVYGTKTAFTNNYPNHASTPAAVPTQSLRASTTDAHPKPTYKPLAHKNNVATGNGISYHQVFLQQQTQYSNDNSQADWGTWYYATANVSNLSFQSGEDTVVRGNFAGAGSLPNSQDPNYRAINDAYPVFGFSLDLGSVSTTSQSSLFQLSLHQQNCVLFESTLNTDADVPCLWTSYFDTDEAAISYFYNDYSNATSLATQLDNQVQSDATSAAGSDYASIASLAVRQAFGAIEFTNTPDTPWVFMEEISSDDNVNTVDVIFPFHPIAIYMNPKILKWLLDPLFINQEAGNWPNAYSIHDIGSTFPQATGHNDGNDEQQPLEECGNMLIMTLAYAQRANDNAYLSDNYDILNQWTGYLVSEALIPQNQISTDDFAGPAANQTNLAIKGIVGIEAMAQIANRTGNAADGANYTNIAHDYVTQWQGFCTDTSANPPHTEFNYNNESTYSLLYNVFGDKELGLDLIPQSVYDMQSTFYPTVFETYGVPLDTRHTYTKVDWQIYCASVADSDTMNQFSSAIASWLNTTPTNFAFTDLYDTVTGDYPDGITFRARPVVGGVFAPLALLSAPTTSTVTPS